MCNDNDKDEKKKDWPLEKLDEADKKKDTEKDEWPLERFEKGRENKEKK